MNKSMSKLYNATFFMSSFTIAQFQQKAKLIENFMLTPADKSFVAKKCISLCSQ